MGPKIIVILLGVFVLGLVIYVVNSNLVGKLSSPFGSLLHYSSSTWYPQSPTSLSSGEGTYLTAASSSPGVTASQNATATISASEIPAGFTLAELSPYFKKITFNGAWAGSYSSYGQITLSSYGLSASDTVDITGWQIKTNRGGEYIPQAIDLYDPSGLTAPTDIQLSQGQYVYLYSSSGPFNLRLNECIGYIANSNKFTPAIPNELPLYQPGDDLENGFYRRLRKLYLFIGFVPGSQSQQRADPAK